MKFSISRNMTKDFRTIYGKKYFKLFLKIKAPSMVLVDGALYIYDLLRKCVIRGILPLQ